MAETYTSKRISELQEATSLTDKDLFVINEFNDTTGYTLTKKVLSKVLYDYAYQYIRKKLKSEDFANLSALAYCDFGNLLLSCVQHKRGGNGKDGFGLLSSDSLALSTFIDLGLGDLATLNREDLHLEQFALKGNSTLVAKTGEYINGIVENDGRITQINTGKFSDAVPIDATLNSTSQNAVLNAAIVAALAAKVDKNGTDFTYSPSEGKYIAGIQQKEGRITNVLTYSIPVLAIDSLLNRMSDNPVSNKVLTDKFSSLKSEIEGNANNTFVKKVDANSTLTAPIGHYITSVVLSNGKLTGIQTSALPSLVAIDSALSEYSTNPVQNKVITAQLNGIANSYVKKVDANSTLTAPNGLYISGITLTNGKLVNINTTTFPSYSGLKYSSSNIVSGSGTVCGNDHDGIVVFTASSDCLISFTVKLLTNITACAWPHARYAWLKYAGSTTKNQLVKMETNGSGLTNCMLLLKQGDLLIVSGACGSGHGTQWSYSGTLLSRT